MKFEKLFELVLVFIITTVPVLMLLTLLSGFNDKPWGYHVVAFSYCRAIGSGMIITCVILRLARRGDPEKFTERCLFYAWVTMMHQVCLFGWWGSLLMEDRTHTWYK